jgi:hypothetical protein
MVVSAWSSNNSPGESVGVGVADSVGVGEAVFVAVGVKVEVGVGLVVGVAVRVGVRVEVEVVEGFCVIVGWRVEIGLNRVGVRWENEHARLKIPSIMNSRVKIFNERCIF